MKSNTFIISVAILGFATLFITLQNSNQLDILTEALNTIQQSMTNRGLSGHNNTVLLTDLLIQINGSGLVNQDFIRFLIDFVHLHINNLPTESELQELINVLKELEGKTGSVSSGNKLGDFYSKFGGPDPGSGGASGIVIPPDNH